MRYAILFACLWIAACGSANDPVSPQQAKISNPPATVHIVSYGQSLSLGERSTVAWPNDLSMPTDYQDVGKMFSGGVHPLDLSTLVTYQESDAPVDGALWNIGTPGETPVYGALLALKDQPGIRIGSTAGRGGTSIVDLGKGSAPYQRVISQVQAGKALSAGAYSVTLIWLQGESDAGNVAYAQEFSQLVMDLDGDIRIITGQGPVQIYVCLPAPRDIAAAQQSVSAAMPQVHIVCDTSTLQKAGDGIHLTAAASRHAGEALGQAMLGE